MNPASFPLAGDGGARPRRRWKKRRIFAVLLVLFLILSLFTFLKWRADDLHAWPLPSTVVADATRVSAPASDVSIVSTAALDAWAASAPNATNAPVAAYHAFQAIGYAAMKPADRAALDARLGGAPEYPVYASFTKFVNDADSFLGAPEELHAAGTWVSQSTEFALWAMYVESATNAARSADPEMLRLMRLLSHGAGVLGFASRVNVAMVWGRTRLMEAADLSTPLSAEQIVARVAALREAESAEITGSLAEALHVDGAAIRTAVEELYDDLEASKDDSVRVVDEDSPKRKLPPTTSFVVNALGAPRAVSLAHVEALFSRLVENAEKPFAADGGLCAGLPAWCGDGRRTPWTRDPIAAMACGGFLRHARYAAALPPSYALELRAARLALALRAWRDEHGEYPAALDEIIGDIVSEKDVLDPFAKDAATTRLRYERDGDGWRFWSVGLDQIDGNGLRDAFTATEDSPKDENDLVYSSRERELRKRSYRVR